ncbi:MAG: hypothetical protein AAFU80_15960 [Pseudomonadota bacterium]
MTTILPSRDLRHVTGLAIDGTRYRDRDFFPKRILYLRSSLERGISKIGIEASILHRRYGAA